MNTNEPSMSVNDSLQIISNAIENAKARYQEDGFIYLFWGWLVLFASLAQFTLLFTPFAMWNFTPWFLMPLGGIFTALYFMRKKHSEHSSSFIGRILSGLWIVIGINLICVPFVFGSMYEEGAGSIIVPFVLVLIGIGTVVSGLTMDHKMLLAGGIICNVLAIFSLFSPTLLLPLITAVAVIFTSLVPGYSLRKQNR